mgnify:CR=1 FL=1
MALTARPATLADAMWLFALRNDPETIRWSISEVPVTPEEHAEWFARAITDPARALMVVESRVIQAGRDFCRDLETRMVPVATYRLDRVSTDQVEASLTVARDQRGRGFAAQVIDLAARHAMREGADSVVALVKRGNTRSLRAFLHAGFRPNPPSTDDGDLLLLGARPEDIAGRLCAACARGVEHHTNSLTSIGRADDRYVIYDQHEEPDGYGFRTYECDAGDLWLAWETARRGRRDRLDARRAQGASAGSTPAASTAHQPCMDADCIICRSSSDWLGRGGDDGE